MDIPSWRQCIFVARDIRVVLQFKTQQRPKSYGVIVGDDEIRADFRTWR
jgi:hypothetical protein